jgi:hypothetical protein
MISCLNKEHSFLADQVIEKLLSKGDLSMLTFENEKNIQKKYYPFLDTLIQDSNPDVRSATLSFMVFISQPWCLKNFLKCMRDPVGTNRSLASLGLEKLSLPDSRKSILDELSFQKSHYFGEDLLPIEGLILTIGKIGTKDDIPQLVSMLEKEQANALRIAYQKALAKLGYEPSRKEIVDELTLGTPLIKKEALAKISYIGSSEWVGKVIPLLLDETVVQSFTIGNARVTKRVCELAINTLRDIDTTHIIPFSDPYVTQGPISYSAQQIESVRTLYGLKSNITE